MSVLERGAIYRYSDLWAREFDAGEESGRKDRPACLLVRPPSQPEIMFMFAITSQEPRKGRIFDTLPKDECKRCGVKPPAWIMLDEYNIATESELHDFNSLEPLGKLSAAYLKKISLTALALARQNAMRAIQRN